MTPFQQVHHQDDEPAFELAPIASPDTFDLIGNIRDIYRGEFARTQKAALLYRPTVEVLFIVNRIARHPWSPHLPRHDTRTLRQPVRRAELGDPLVLAMPARIIRSPSWGHGPGL